MFNRGFWVIPPIDLSLVLLFNESVAEALRVLLVYLFSYNGFDFRGFIAPP